MDPCRLLDKCDCQNLGTSKAERASDGSDHDAFALIGRKLEREGKGSRSTIVPAAGGVSNRVVPALPLCRIPPHGADNQSLLVASSQKCCTSARCATVDAQPALTGRSAQARIPGCVGGCNESSGVLSHLDQFLHRGTPRHATRSVPRHNFDQQQLWLWAHGRGVPPNDVRLLILNEAGEDGADRRGRRPRVQEALMLWHGVAVQLRIAPGAGASGMLGTVIRAETACAWPAARAALAAAQLGPIESFLDALLQAWQANEASPCPEGSPDTCSDASLVASTNASPDASAGHGTLDSARISPDTCALHGTSQESVHSKVDLGVTGDTLRSCEPERNEGLRQESDHCEVVRRSHSFADWLSDRPPLWRFDHASSGLAWDYPPSKVEKRELLVLHLVAEEEERREELIGAECRLHRARRSL